MDELDNALATLESGAPEQQQVEQAPVVADPAAQQTQQTPPADEWKPPAREEYENVQKALRAEREQRRQTARQVQQAAAERQALEDKFTAFQQRVYGHFRSQAPPDPMLDPDGARAWQQQVFEENQQLVQEREQQSRQQTEQQRQTQAVQALQQAVDDFETEFQQAHPDYEDASAHVMQTQQKLIEGMGYTPQQAEAAVRQWAMSLAYQAIQSGRNPAQVTYESAKQMGWSPKPAPSAQAAADKIKQIQAGQQSAQTLSGGGTMGDGGLSLAKLASLEGAAFDAAADKFLREAVRG